MHDAGVVGMIESNVVPGEVAGRTGHTEVRRLGFVVWMVSVCRQYELGGL
jgi:hypothetical protein